MKLPLKWLKEYVDFNVTIEEFTEKMMWRGFEIASVTEELFGITNVVVGKILSIEKHPNADKLQVCKIDTGLKVQDIITAATNVFEGAFVPVALSGATLADGKTIQDTEMRGIVSRGMLCSIQELGMAPYNYPEYASDGIMILKGEYKTGTPIKSALDMQDIIFDIELTPNRPDCQSIIGMCREIAAMLGQKFKEPCIKPVKGVKKSSDYASVTVLNPALCPRYLARVVVDQKIEQSPEWLRKKLISVGMRPINNIVDITNLVMLEYGHPMHAFDLACVKNGHIVVRNANEDETVVTLDGKPRKVTPDMLLIADEEKGVGIAGVMGGENSEIKQTTGATLFESAVFLGSNIRSTARKLRHMTDAAQRFIKGVEPINAELALNRAMELIEELGCGTVIGENIDVCSAKTEEPAIKIDVGHVNSILNTTFSAEEMSELLSAICIKSEPDGNTLMLTIPHFRTDIENGLEADWNIAEEIARLHGYYNIPATLMRGDTLRGCLTEEFRCDDRIKDAMAGEGAYEMYNYNFIGPETLNRLLLAENSEKRQAVRLLNPFGEDQSLMRTTLIPGMLNTLALNFNRKTGHTRFFEVGNVHFNNNDDLPEERNMLGIAYYTQNEDFLTLKGSIESLLEEFGITGCKFVRGHSEYFHPGKNALIEYDGQILGEFGAVHPKVLDAFGLSCEAYVAEISTAMLLKNKAEAKTYVPLPRFPVVERDIAVVVQEKVKSSDLAELIALADAGVLVERVELFDVYRGKGIEDGYKSMAYSFVLRADDHTLSDEEITLAMNRIIDALRRETGAELRGA